MRDRMERLVLLPFSIGCVSEASVAIGVHQPRGTSKPGDYCTNTSSTLTKEEDEESSTSSESMKMNSLKFLALTTPNNISTGIHKLVKGFKNFSQLFAYKEEIEENMEMEIGQPTDVKHVTHIGWDANASASAIQEGSWDNLISPELLSLHLPSATTPRQFGHVALTAAAQANNNSPLVSPPSAN